MSLVRRAERWYPDWGTVEMRFSEYFRNSVGFVLRDDGTPNGTFFLIQFRVSRPSAGVHRNSVWLVTARHCLEGIKRPRVRYRGPLPDGQVLDVVPEWYPKKWHSPRNTDIDLAVAKFDPSESVSVNAIPADYNTVDVGREVDLGELVYYVGLWDISARYHRGAVPVVRSATVGAFNERDIKAHDRGRHVGTWPLVHLIDTRSRDGFSGSPVFVQRLVTRAWREEDLPLPTPWLVRASEARTDMRTLGEVATLTDLWGLFVGWSEVDGIGLVLPVEAIFDFFDNELGDLMEEEQHKAEEIRPGEKTVRRAKAADEIERLRNFVDNPGDKGTISQADRG